MSLPAYFLTWTTYGTWLHGDSRGSWEDLGDSTRALPAHEPLREDVERRLAEVPFRLDQNARSAVEQAVREHCEHRGWNIDALNVRSNHVHIVVRALTHEPMEVVGQLKAWSTRRLRAAGLIDGRVRVWTKKASTRWINDPDSHARAVAYVRDFQ